LLCSLCGGINSGIAKQCKLISASLAASGADYSVFIVGEKGRPPLGNYLHTKDKILTSINDNWTVPTNFSQVSAIALQISAVPDVDNYVFVYNTFESVISYTVSAQNMKGVAYDPEAEEMDALLGAYETEPEDRGEVMQSLSEYAMACAMYSNFLDQAASFQSSQMSAMENATINADELIGDLTVKYNRARQARITTELIEIISGASALDG
jgi:F-type H+-transporting ATPase subunit gamma